MDYEGFKKSVLSLTGIDLSSYKEKQMKRRIDSLITRHKCKGYEEFLNLIKHDNNVFEEFVAYLTINVSEFYRNPDQWKFMDEVVFPELIKKFGQNLKIWSAACSTGDEPYSLVMALSKHVPLNKISIYATDIDKQILAKAKVGLYNEKSIEGVPAEFKTKYFEKIGGSYKIKDEIKNRVDFHQHNLLADKYETGFHMIVCRNVLIYFTDEAKDDIFKKYYNSLRPGGVLFIGSTEQIMNYAEVGYKRKNSFFYEK
ncbi:MAG: protein-glutamate O-methyltransferase CheR [Lachnospiraceae bacterium]|nr:protein-glutamate O-methyltransferase CheR [Lachnospiraceae bacterium]